MPEPVIKWCRGDTIRLCIERRKAKPQKASRPAIETRRGLGISSPICLRRYWPSREPLRLSRCCGEIGLLLQGLAPLRHSAQLPTHSSGHGHNPGAHVTRQAVPRQRPHRTHRVGRSGGWPPSQVGRFYIRTPRAACTFTTTVPTGSVSAVCHQCSVAHTDNDSRWHSFLRCRQIPAHVSRCAQYGAAWRRCRPDCSVLEVCSAAGEHINFWYYVYKWRYLFRSAMAGT